MFQIAVVMTVMILLRQQFIENEKWIYGREKEVLFRRCNNKRLSEKKTTNENMAQKTGRFFFIKNMEYYYVCINVCEAHRKI